MTKQEEKIARVLYAHLFQGYLISFEEALKHSKGEPMLFYGNELEKLACEVNEVLDGG